MKNGLTLVLFVVSFVAVTGCTSTPTDRGKPLPELTFAHLNPLPVNVSRIEFTNNTQRGAQIWDVTGNLPTPPDIAMRRYLNQRFKADGADGILNITLSKADVIEQTVPNDIKLLSYIDLADQENYRFEIIVDLERLYFTGEPNTRTSIRFTRDAKMPSNVSLAYREAKLQRTLEEMIRDIDEALVTTIGYKFNLISPNDIPRQALPVGTVLPETETKIGEFIDSGADSLGSPQPIVPPQNDEVIAEPLNP